MTETLLHYWWVIPIFVGLLALWIFGKALMLLFGLVMTPSDSVAVIVKKFVITNAAKSLPDGHFVALNGEPGLQADVLAPGLRFGFWPWQYTVKFSKFVSIPKGKVGVVEARDGIPIPAGRILGKTVLCDMFQDTRAFLSNGGERGPQETLIPPGTYRINPDMFDVKLFDAFQVPEGKIGVVTTFDGAPLTTGVIAGKVIPGHNGFQDVQVFIKAGGSKGLQEDVLRAGTYYLNPCFCSVQLFDMLSVPIGHAGVVVSYVGDDMPASDPNVPNTGPKQGRVVDRGYKGVWREPLDPGMFPINPHTCDVHLVPTTNIVLNWANDKNEAHKLDQNLSTITVRSKDGFTYNLDVSQIIHISRDKAPNVIARFGELSNLVTQVLEPVIGNYFRNSAQENDCMDFLQNRLERQAEAKKMIEEAIGGHDVEAVDTLIGDIATPAELMTILKEQKLAEKEVATYKAQETAAKSLQQLRLAEAEANTREQVVQAQRKKEVAILDADSEIERARGEAGAKRANADADAYVQSTVGAATAQRTLAVGNAEAEVQRAKVQSIGSDSYALIIVAEALAKAGIALVPQIQVSSNGGEGGTGNGLVDAFIGNMLAKDRQEQTPANPKPAETSAPTTPVATPTEEPKPAKPDKGAQA